MLLFLLVCALRLVVGASALPQVTTAASTNTAGTTTTSSGSSCPCTSTAAPAPTATALTCGYKGVITQGGIVPVNTGGTGNPTTVDLLSTCANLCFTEYGNVCQSFSVYKSGPDGLGCNLWAYNISSLSLSPSDASSAGSFYERACYEQTCPYNPTGSSTCPPTPTTTSGSYTTCTCAAIATPYPFNNGHSCGYIGTAAATATPYTTIVAPYDSSNGYDTAKNYYADERFCGKSCLLDTNCASFEVTNPDPNLDGHSCLLYTEDVAGTGFVQSANRTGNGAYDRDCWLFECDSGVTGC